MTTAALVRPTTADGVLAHVPDGADVVVPLGNGEPAGILDVLEHAAAAGRLHDVRVHQMHPLRDRPYLRGEVAGLRHVAYFLSHLTRRPYAQGHVDLVPNHFSEVPELLADVVRPALVVAACSPPDDDGWVSLGVGADYAASLIDRVPFFLEVNRSMPRTRGRHRLHLSQAAGWCEADYPLVTSDPAPAGPVEEAIAGYVADRIPDGVAVQAGIGGIPNAVLAYLRQRRDLTVHTELLSDGFAQLIDAGAVSNRRSLVPGTTVTTFALGSERLYRWLDQRDDVAFHPVDWVNDPRVIGSIDGFVSINATTEVDLYGQCASETVAGRYWSSSGGQADFARGARYSRGGKGFIVLPSTAKGGEVSRIQVQLSPGSVVTTLKNTVDHVVTEWGVAELRGRPIADRARALIGIAHPRFRDDLEREARAQGVL